MKNQWFTNEFGESEEKNLLDELVSESIQIMGEDMYYVPRNLNHYDSIYGEDNQSSYTKSFLIEMYIKSVDGFQGDGNFMSRFGIEIRDQVTFSMSKSRFDEEIGSIIEIDRPRESDLIYFPLNKKTFMIKSVNKYETFYQLGDNFTWEVTCENFVYSNEKFDTGIPEIDSTQTLNETNELSFELKDTDGNILVDVDGNAIMDTDSDELKVFASDNDQIEKEAQNIIVDFSKENPFSI